jgi:hypothetical protein
LQRVVPARSKLHHTDVFTCLDIHYTSDHHRFVPISLSSNFPVLSAFFPSLRFIFPPDLRRFSDFGLRPSTFGLRLSYIVSTALNLTFPDSIRSYPCAA